MDEESKCVTSSSAAGLRESENDCTVNFDDMISIGSYVSSHLNIKKVYIRFSSLYRFGLMKLHFPRSGLSWPGNYHK